MQLLWVGCRTDDRRHAVDTLIIFCAARVENDKWKNVADQSSSSSVGLHRCICLRASVWQTFCSHTITWIKADCTFLTFVSWLSAGPTGLSSSVRVWSQLWSRARRTKVSPSKQSSARGSSFLLANGSGWQHHSSTMAFQFPLGRGRTRLNVLKERKWRKTLTVQKGVSGCVTRSGKNYQFTSIRGPVSVNT